MKTSTQPANQLGTSPKERMKPDTLKVFFFGCWAFFGIYYGDILHQAWQHNGFSTDPDAMRSVWEQSYGSLWIIGRTLFQAFRYPFWGGALLSVVLTLITWLFGYVCKLRGKLSFLRFIPAFVYTYVLLWYGLAPEGFSETGMIFGIPFCILIILILQALFIRSFSKKHITGLFTHATYNRAADEWAALAFVFLLTAGAVLLNEGVFA